MEAAFLRTPEGRLRTGRPVSEDELIEYASALLRERVRTLPTLNRASLVRDFLRLRLGPQSRELFGVLFLTHQRQFIDFEIMFMGSLQGAPVHPREVARRALELNAACVILAHNHPSGDATPSPEDIALTHRIDQSLQLLGMYVLDHLVLTPDQGVSLVQSGHWPQR